MIKNIQAFCSISCIINQPISYLGTCKVRYSPSKLMPSASQTIVDFGAGYLTLFMNGASDKGIGWHLLVSLSASAN